MTPLQTYEAKREPQFGKKKSFCLIKNGDILQLDRKHHYLHQVQGQGGVSGLRWNDFMLMTDLTLGDQEYMLKGSILMRHGMELHHQN